MKLDLSAFPILSTIDSPENLRTLSPAKLLALADELREFLLQSLNHCGGHLGAGLGTIELAIALHTVYNTPYDPLVWDVGHQAYPHKILTGRRDTIHTIRQTNGLAPFPKMAESPYDSFGVGHSSTSISAALGMAIAAKLSGEPRKPVAVIGDGAMTAGMAFEALNHAGHIHADLLVVLNDNEMSISQNVGALSNYFSRVLTGKAYTRLREGSKKMLAVMPAPLWDIAKRTEAHVKSLVAPPGTLFEELGMNYVGPIDGHDLPTLLDALKNLRERSGPQLLHVVTRKGKGYEPAEIDPIGYHAVPAGFYSPKQAQSTPAKKKALTYSAIFGEWLCDIAQDDPRVVGITPAMREGSDLIKFSEQFPDRYFDVGIAEQHSVTVAAGMATLGKKPIVAIYSSFLQRAYDQLIHDVAIQNLPVVFAIDRAGLVGGDGSTHNGSFDLSFLRCIPNLIVLAPSNENELRQALYTAYLYDGPSAVRYPRGTGPGVTIEKQMTAFPLGKANLRRQGKKIAILAFGSMVTPCLEVGETLNATVVDMRWVKPLDEELILKLAQEHELIVTVEENVRMGGAGSAVNEVLAAANCQVALLNLGLPDYYIEHGKTEDLLIECGLDTHGILMSIRKRCNEWLVSSA